MKKFLITLAMAAFAVTSQAQVTVAKPAEKPASAPAKEAKKEVKRNPKPAEKAASAPAKK